MNSETNERRERPRVGVIAELEDITYCILRRHGVSSVDLIATQSRLKPITE